MAARATGKIIACSLFALLLLPPATPRAQDAQEQNQDTPAGAGPQVPGEIQSEIPGEAPMDASIDPMQDIFMHINIQESFRRRMAVAKPDVMPRDFETASLFFTPWQYALLREAKRGSKNRPRPPTAEELQDDFTLPQEQREKGIRELSLGGIMYSNSDKWIIWLNGQRVTPDALPKEALDLEVFNDFIQMKWFDGYTNLVFPLRLRPHQRFNLDSRIFLPGAGIAANDAAPF